LYGLAIEKSALLAPPVRYAARDRCAGAGQPALTGRVLMVNKITVGGIYDFYRTEHLKAGIGALLSKYWLPNELQPLYSSDPTSGMASAGVKVM
jgi:hypothetical protein